MRPSKPLSPKKPLQPYRGPTSRPGLQSSPGVHRGPLLSVQELKGGAKRPRSVTPDEKEVPTSESENRRRDPRFRVVSSATQDWLLYEGGASR